MLKDIFTVIFILILGWILLVLPGPEGDGLRPGRQVERKQPVYRSGVFIGRGEGFASEVIVEVIVESAEEKPYFYIKDIHVLESNDIEKYFQPVKKKVINRILREQTLEVDVVTKATQSRRGLLEAIENALDKARRGN